MSENASKLGKFLGLGAATAVLYGLLFANEHLVLELSGQGKWWFVLPLAIAFVLSFVHGAFKGEFWDVLGVKAKKQ